MRETEEEKESKRGVEIVDNVWRRKKRKRNKSYGFFFFLRKINRMVESEIEKRKMI